MRLFSSEPSKGARPLFRSAALVTLMTFFSRITGLFQSRMLAHYLGVGAAFDAFSVAYRIPNLLRRFAAEGTMTGAFLPTVSQVEAEQGEESARELVARFTGTLAILLLLLSALGMVVMGLLVGLQLLGRLPGSTDGARLIELGRILLGRSQPPAQVALTTTLGRIMFPYIALVSLTAALSAMLNLRGRFALPASVSTFWNLAFLAFGYVALHWGPPSWREPLRATLVFGVAVVFGGIVQLLALWPSFRSLGYSIRWGLHLRHPGVGRILKRMSPGLLGTGIHPINVMISMAIASHLRVGAQGVLLNANMMGEIVLGLFSVSLATVSLPALSRLMDEGDIDGFRQSLSSALRGTAIMTIPGSVGLAVLAYPIIAVLFRTGRFGADDVAWTAWTLSFQALGLLFIATSRIVAQSLYALKDFRTPAYAALAGMGANVVFSLLLMGPLNTSGIALANGLSSMVNLSLLVWSLHRHLPDPPYIPVLRGWFGMSLAAGLMGCVAWKGAQILQVSAWHGLLHASLRLFPLIGVSACVYFLLLRIMRIPEAMDITALIQRKLRRS